MGCVRSSSVTALALAAGLLGGCGVYFHNDSFQKKTDAAADAVEAAIFTPRIQEIGKEAVAVSGEYESAIIQRDIALRNRVSVAVVKKPIALAPQPPASPDPSDPAWHGIGLLQSETNRRMGEIVGPANIAEYGNLGSDLHADMASLQKDLAGQKRDYDRAVQDYRAKSLTHKKEDLSCGSLLALPAEEKSAPELIALVTYCFRIAEFEERIAQRLYGDVGGSLDSACDAHIAVGELQDVYCAIRESEAETKKAKAEKERLSAAIKALAEKYKPSGVEGDPADAGFIAEVKKLQAALESADLPKAARAFGYDSLADVLKEALAFDVSAAVGAATDGAAAPSSGDGRGGTTPGGTILGDASKAAMAGAIIRVVTTGVRFGRAYEAQPPFERANTIIIALAELRHKAGVAEIEAQAERARITYLQRRQEALIREIDLLSASWRLQQGLSPNADIMSLEGDAARQADAALAAYVAAVDRGLIPNDVFKERVRNVAIKELDAISVLGAQSTDQVAKAAADALRAYGRGGVDPDVVFGEILGLLAVVGIWL